MNTPGSSPAIGVAAAASAAPITSTFSKGFFGLGIVLTIGGIIVLALTLTGFFGNLSDINKENSILGGSISLIVGVAVLMYSSGKVSSIVAFFNQTGTMKAISSTLLVIIISATIFFAIFWNYSSTSDTVSLSTSILIMLVTAGAFFALFKYSGQVPIANFITTMLFVLYHFLPYAVFLFGILIDIYTRRIEFIGASFTGATAVLLNFALSRSFTGGAPPSGMNPICEIPGLSTLSSNFAPQPIVFVSSTLAYIATYLTATVQTGNNTAFAPGVVAAWPPWTLLVGTSLLQWGVMSINKCYPGNLFPKVATGLIGGSAYGSILGAIAYAVFKNRYNPPTAPGAAPSVPTLGPGGTQTCPDGSTPGPDGQCPSASQQSQRLGTCAAGSGDGEFICESFENGKLKRRVITE
jgi:hypothetical protein